MGFVLSLLPPVLHTGKAKIGQSTPKESAQPLSAVKLTVSLGGDEFFMGKFFCNDCCDATVRPYIDSCFKHVKDGIDR